MAELVILQKDDENLDFLKFRLESFPKHKIVHEAHNLFDSLRILDIIDSNILHIEDYKIPDAIVLDGNFSTDAYPCYDAAAVINTRDRLNLKIHAIGYSFVFLSQYDSMKIHPSLDIGKNPNNLLRVLSERFE